ncbi:hypothetical protein BGY98DRAFT_1011189, partial [Russula aff. rugulosa BPL654]
MAKCEPWKAQGGKSRSDFWKTSDNRFIIKTVVNAWNVAEFHMDSTAESSVGTRESARLLYCRSSKACESVRP